MTRDEMLNLYRLCKDQDCLIGIDGEVVTIHYEAFTNTYDGYTLSGHFKLSQKEILSADLRDVTVYEPWDD